jgi:hypothetical protein
MSRWENRYDQSLASTASLFRHSPIPRISRFWGFSRSLLDVKIDDNSEDSTSLVLDADTQQEVHVHAEDGRIQDHDHHIASPYREPGMNACEEQGRCIETNDALRTILADAANAGVLLLLAVPVYALSLAHSNSNLNWNSNLNTTTDSHSHIRVRIDLRTQRHSRPSWCTSTIV